MCGISINCRTKFYGRLDGSYANISSNEADKARAASAGEDPGGMIMIHGQRNYLGWLSPLTQWFDWTNGCIAVSNAEMDEIWDLVKNGTPIEIRP